MNYCFGEEGGCVAGNLCAPCAEALRERAEAAEAEVARLRAELRKIQRYEVAAVVSESWGGDQYGTRETKDKDGEWVKWFDLQRVLGRKP